MNGMAPKYIADLLQSYIPTRQLRSSSKNLLVTPKSNLKFYSVTDDMRSIHWSIELVDYPFFLLLYIFSVVNLSKSNVSYLLEINFYNCYIYSLITQRFFIFRLLQSAIELAEMALYKFLKYYYYYYYYYWITTGVTRAPFCLMFGREIRSKLLELIREAPITNEKICDWD